MIAIETGKRGIKGEYPTRMRILRCEMDGRLRKKTKSYKIFSAWGINSAGQSASFARKKSSVRIRHAPPSKRCGVFWARPNTLHHIKKMRAISSAGQSASLIMTRSQVQVLDRPPQFRDFFSRFSRKMLDKENQACIMAEVLRKFSLKPLVMCA